MQETQPTGTLTIAVRALLVLSAVKLLLHLFTNQNYGYFIDELYYVACSEHLGFGYVDHPPMIALVTWVARAILGDSLPALRLFPAIVGAATVFVSGLIARELGGGRFAQVMTGVAVIVIPLFLFMNTVLSMNALDVLIWTVAAWLVALIINRGRDPSVPRLWLLLGLVLGLGLENKISVLFFGFGLTVGLLLTGERKHFKTPWPWCAGVVAFLLFLPHIIWQVVRGWPTLEFMHNASVLKNRPLTLLEFLNVQFLESNPLNFVILLFGLWFFLISRLGSRYRLFGWLYLAFFLVLVFRNGKPYYAGAVYPLMFAGGSVYIEKLLSRVRAVWPQWAVIFAMMLSGAALAPMTLPVLPVETFIRYQRLLLGGPPGSSEQKEVGDLPQHYADMFGNEELAELVAEVYHELAPDEQARTAIYGMAYPQAGAIDLFGPRYGLPKAISGHNSYWLWGPGENASEKDIVIVMGLNEEMLKEVFDEVILARVFRHDYAMPWRNNLPVFVCREPGRPLDEIWPELKHYE